MLRKSIIKRSRKYLNKKINKNEERKTTTMTRPKENIKEDKR
jgi:hypothetical protein